MPINRAPLDSEKRFRIFLFRILGLLSILSGIFFGSIPTVSADEANLDDPPAPPIEQLVQRYLQSKGPEGDLVLAEILRHPQAGIEKVESILQTESPYGRQPVGMQPGTPVTVRGETLSYGLYVPQSYDPAQAYPLMVCLHGAGFDGDDYLEKWQPRLAENGDRYVLACPSYPEAAWWTRKAEELVLAVITDVESRYHIDSDRVFLSGMSNGGIGAYIIGSNNAPLFAGVVPMASGIDDVLMPFLENFKNTPVYIIHSSKDLVMPVT